MPLCLVACVFYPKQVSYYDENCNDISKKFVLEESRHNYAVNTHCDDECLLLSLGIITVGAVVAGSVVVIGNTIYWFERQLEC